jgi:hypothetical protein
MRVPGRRRGGDYRRIHLSASCSSWCLPAPGSARDAGEWRAHKSDSFPRNMRSVEVLMVLCPIALAVGCRKCPIFSICPVKSIIGDYKPDVAAKKAPQQRKGKTGAK